jgi:tetratricopeptide (TPR) repeat protein
MPVRALTGAETAGEVQVTHLLTNLLLVASLMISMPADPGRNPEKDSRDWAKKGISLARSQEYEGARDCFAEALRISNINALAHLGHGACLFALGEFEDARKSIEKAINTDSYCPISRDAGKLLYDDDRASKTALLYGLKEQLGLDHKAFVIGGEQPCLIYARSSDPEPLKALGMKKMRKLDLVALLNLGEGRWQLMHLAERGKRELFLHQEDDETYVWLEKKPKKKRP